MTQKYRMTPAPLRVLRFVDVEPPTVSSELLSSGELTLRVNPRPTSPNALNRSLIAYWAPNEPDTKLAWPLVPVTDVVAALLVDEGLDDTRV